MNTRTKLNESDNNVCIFSVWKKKARKKDVDREITLRYNAQAVGERGTRNAPPADMILENDTEMKNAEQLSICEAVQEKTVNS